LNLMKFYLSRHKALEGKRKQNADAKQYAGQIHVIVTVVLQQVPFINRSKRQNERKSLFNEIKLCHSK
jgi:hypothetical protein